ncbi:MAG TPA: cation diffusion facilitator family transporter [Verrucomicrobiae bacterium]
MANRLERTLKATFVGMGVNAVLTAFKFAAGIVGHSHALIADAVESTADILSSIIVWRGLVVAAEPPDREHPYGHGKAEPLAAASVAIMLLLAAFGIIIKSAAELTDQQRERPRAFTLVVLLGVVVVKELLFRFVSSEAKSADSIAVHTDAWHHRSDAITSLAAAIGITFTLVGGRNFLFADDAAAILAGLIIVWNGWRLLQPALSELMDASPNLALIAKIKSTAGKVPGVRKIEKCMVRKAGFQYFVDMHVEVDPEITVREGHAIAHDVKNRVREAMPTVSDVLVHIEPSQKSSTANNPSKTGSKP